MLKPSELGSEFLCLIELGVLVPKAGAIFTLGSLFWALILLGSEARFDFRQSNFFPQLEHDISDV